MTLFVSDLDGTLLNNSAEVSPESAILLNKSIESGINFTIATARTPATIVNILKDINIKLPIITMNGSAIYDIKNDNNTIRNHELLSYFHILHFPHQFFPSACHSRSSIWNGLPFQSQAFRCRP